MYCLQTHSIKNDLLQDRQMYCLQTHSIENDLLQDRQMYCLQTHSIENDLLQDRQMYCLQVCACILHPGHLTGWSSEGVKTRSGKGKELTRLQSRMTKTTCTPSSLSFSTAQPHHVTPSSTITMDPFLAARNLKKKNKNKKGGGGAEKPVQFYFIHVL